MITAGGAGLASTQPSHLLVLALFVGSGGLVAYGSKVPHRAVLQILAAAAAAAGGVALYASIPLDLAAQGGLVLLMTWFAGWAALAPWRAAGLEATAKCVGLLAFGFLFAVPVLAGRDGASPEGWTVRGAVPDWVMQLSPLARLHGSVFSEDWLHEPGLYHRLGEAYYQYPSLTDGLWIWLGVVLFSLTLSHGLRRRGRRLEADRLIKPSPEPSRDLRLG